MRVLRRVPGAQEGLSVEEAVSGRHPWPPPPKRGSLVLERHSCSGDCCDAAEVPRDDCPSLDDEWVSPVGGTRREAMLERQSLPTFGGGLDAKLRVFDEYADQARDELVRLLTEDWEYVKAVARGRHAWGHFRYGDSLMFEYEPNQLAAETVEELADGVVYTARRLSL